MIITVDDPKEGSLNPEGLIDGLEVNFYIKPKHILIFHIQLMKFSIAA